MIPLFMFRSTANANLMFLLSFVSKSIASNWVPLTPLTNFFQHLWCLCFVNFLQDIFKNEQYLGFYAHRIRECLDQRPEKEKRRTNLQANWQITSSLIPFICDIRYFSVNIDDQIAPSLAIIFQSLAAK